MESNSEKRKKEIDPKHLILLNKIGERMKELRKLQGFKNYEMFAYQKELPRAQYGKYEGGKSDMTLTNLMKVLDALDITLEDFFKGIK